MDCVAMIEIQDDTNKDADGPTNGAEHRSPLAKWWRPVLGAGTTIYLLAQFGSVILFTPIVLILWAIYPPTEAYLAAMDDWLGFVGLVLGSACTFAAGLYGFRQWGRNKGRE